MGQMVGFSRLLGLFNVHFELQMVFSLIDILQLKIELILSSYQFGMSVTYTCDHILNTLDGGFMVLVIS